jgi:hypothetical protein
VVDCRHAVDVLEQLPFGPIAATSQSNQPRMPPTKGASQPQRQRLVDPERIAYVGHSLGATWGGALAVSERRMKALVQDGWLFPVFRFNPR